MGVSLTFSSSFFHAHLMIASIPKCHWFGQHDGYNCLAIDLLGMNLKEWQDQIKTIPLETIIHFGCQLVNCFRYMHELGIIYRDLKPENLCLLPHHSLKIVDFGLATWWKNTKTNIPHPPYKTKHKTGTARYASIPVHHGQTHARRDDMESLGYLLLDLFIDLPWSGVVAKSCKAGWDRIRQIKERTPLKRMCVGLPVGLLHFIEYTRRLEFYDRPDYDYLISLLTGCLSSGPYSSLVELKNNQKARLMHELSSANQRSPISHCS
jgi:serine/threonine protein kinase